MRKNTFRDTLPRFLFGGALYMTLEVTFRTFFSGHRVFFSMLPVGGLVYIGIGYIYEQSRFPLAFRWIAAGMYCISVEFFSGILLNNILRLGVWYYDDPFLNLYGNICAKWGLVWLALISAYFAFRELTGKRKNI